MSGEAAMSSSTEDVTELQLTTERRLATLEYSPANCVTVLVYLSLAAVIGTCANSLISAVYLLKSNKCPHEIFMLCVAALNLFGSCCFIPWEILTVWSDSDSCNNPPDYIIIFSMFLECCSALLFLSIAIDRYLAICWATHYLMNPTKAIVISIVSIVVSVVLAAVPVVKPEYILIPHLIYPIVLFIVLALIILLYSRVFLTVNAQAKKARDQRLKKQLALTHTNSRKVEHDEDAENAIGEVEKQEKKFRLCGKSESKDSSKRATSSSAAPEVGKEKHIMEEMRDKTVKILISVTLVYIFCFVPSSIINFAFYISPSSFFHLAQAPAMLIKTMQLGYYLNFALSPIVYAALSGRFRDDTKVIICKKDPRSLHQVKTTVVTREADV